MIMKELNANTIKGSIYGGAVGDALGMSVECVAREVVRLMNFKEIESKINWFTDDTSMTLASMDALSETLFTPSTFMENFSKWLYEGKYTVYGYPYGYGKCTKKAIENYNENRDIYTCGCDGFNNNGNGALMRITPVCLALLKTQDNWGIIVSLLSLLTGITHAHKISMLANVMYCAFLYELIESKNKRLALRFMQNFKYEKYFNEETISYFKDLLENETISEPEDKRNFGVVETLKSVIYCIMNTNSFEDSIKCAIRLGYDTDTIAAITGNLAGILYGYESIPDKWLRDLKGKELINEMIIKFNNRFLKEVK